MGEDGGQPEYWAFCRNCCRYRRRVELREIWIRDGCLDLEGEKRCKAESAKFYEYGVR